MQFEVKIAKHMSIEYWVDDKATGSGKWRIESSYPHPDISYHDKIMAIKTLRDFYGAHHTDEHGNVGPMGLKEAKDTIEKIKDDRIADLHAMDNEKYRQQLALAQLQQTLKGLQCSERAHMLFVPCVRCSLSDQIDNLQEAINWAGS